MTVDGVGFHTAVQVHGVVREEGVIVRGGQSHVPAEHLVVRPLEDTAVREHGDRKRVRIVGIGVQVGVGIPDRGRLHGTVGLRLVGIVQDVVLARGSGVLDRAEGGQLQLLEQLPFQLALETEVRHIQVHVVVLELVDDVERSVVAGVELVRIQGAGRIQRVGIRVDVEVALDGAADDIDAGTEGARSLLRTIGRVRDDVQREVLQDPERAVDVAGVTLDGALERPARVIHDGQGGVVVSLVGTAGHRDGMVVLDVVGEQAVEPVGVAHFGGTQVGGPGLVRILQAELARRLVVQGDQFVHLAIDTALGIVGRRRIVQIALLFQFLVNGHLVLGIHDVEGRVIRLQAHRVFTRIGDPAAAGLTLLRGDDDNAGHGAGAVDGGRGAVLQDVETLDIVGVQTGDGRGDQGVGITGGQGFRIHFHDVFHDHAIDDPQRLGGAVDGGRAADADLRSRTESTGDVLHGDTGDTSFQRAGNVGHTGQRRFLRVQLGGRTGEQAAVHLGHTGHDRLLEDFGIRPEGDADVVLHWNFRLLIAHEGNHEVLRILRHLVQDKVTVLVRDGSDLGLAFHRHERSDDRFSVFSRDDRTADRPRLCRSRHQPKEEGADTEQIG